jgi:putative Mg2+ transporter-C (MgtC) family protein
MMQLALPETALGHWQIAIRICLATLLGAAIGIDREIKKRPAGLRTHMLVALAAAVFSIISIEITRTVQPGREQSFDPVRIIEAVTAGVAFLAAGSIIQSGRTVQGLTTGAGLWLAGAVGLACGLGLWSIGVMAAAMGLFVLVVLGGLSSAGPTEKTTDPANDKCS